MAELIFPVTPKEAQKHGVEFSSSANKNAVFPTRLRELRKEAGVSQGELADILGLSKSTIGLYETGDTLPDAQTLYKMAEFFRVTADYLLCRTHVNTTNIEMQKICDYTGLSVHAIKRLNELVNKEEYSVSLQFVHSFLTKKGFDDFERFSEWAVLSDISYWKMRGPQLKQISSETPEEETARMDKYQANYERTKSKERDQLWDEVTGKRPPGGSIEISRKTASELYKKMAEGYISGCLDEAMLEIDIALCEKYNIKK